MKRDGWGFYSAITMRIRLSEKLNSEQFEALSRGLVVEILYTFVNLHIHENQLVPFKIPLLVLAATSDFLLVKLLN